MQSQFTIRKSNRKGSSKPRPTPRLTVIEGALSIYRKGDEVKISNITLYQQSFTIGSHEFIDGEMYLWVVPNAKLEYRVKASQVERLESKVA